MRLRIIVMTALLLLPASFTLADEGHSHTNELSDDIEMFKDAKGSVEGSHDSHMVSPEEHSKMTNETENSDHNEPAEGGHGHGTEVIEETPPNYTVLSVFGAINLSFLIIGLWNNRIRKKVNTDDNA